MSKILPAAKTQQIGRASPAAEDSDFIPRKQQISLIRQALKQTFPKIRPSAWEIILPETTMSTDKNSWHGVTKLWQALVYVKRKDGDKVVMHTAEMSGSIRVPSKRLPFPIMNDNERVSISNPQPTLTETAVGKHIIQPGRNRD